MTLREWADKQPIALWEHASGIYMIPDAANLVDRAQAWHLEDYAVRSVQGGAIWFGQRHKESK